MQTVWKFTISTKKHQQIEMPLNSHIIKGDVQNDKPVIWVLVNTENPNEKRNFELVATGSEIKGKDFRYVCSFNFSEGRYVQHLFEINLGKVSEKEVIVEKEKATTSKKNKVADTGISFSIFKSKKPKKISKAEINDKIKGTLFGHAIGDAIGLSTEFMTKAQVAYNYPKGVNSYTQIISDKHRKSWTPGEWTDDTEQMLCILDSLLEKKKVDPINIAQKIHFWAYNGGRGIGNTTYKVLTSPDFLIDPIKVSEQIWEESRRNLAANGAVMRTSVVGLWNHKNDDDVIKNAEKIAKITHFDPRCTGSSAVVSLAIAKLLQGYYDFDIILGFLRPVSSKFDKRIDEYIVLAKNRSISTIGLDERNSIGYTLKTMAAGLWALKHNNFKKCIGEIIHEGGDADTNAAVAGAVLGAKLGFEKLPKDWVDGLLEKKKLESKVNDFIELLGTQD
ncbi:MAG: ADP-ribosylglycohydrolase family protein [Chloroflexia bacterium]|nr:ADP-ribosylglycohydrolase family protein [Chloroflexia bacterium]